MTTLTTQQADDVVEELRFDATSAAQWRLIERSIDRAIETVLAPPTLENAYRAIGMRPPPPVQDHHELRPSDFAERAAAYGESVLGRDSLVMLSASYLEAQGATASVYEAERLSGQQLSAGQRRHALQLQDDRFARAFFGVGRLADVSPAELSRSLFAERQAEVGVVGTKAMRGQIRVEQNDRFAPFLVRGRNGDPKLYDEMYRADGGAFRNSNEISGLVCSAIFEPKIPKSYSPALAELVRRIDRSFKRARCGGTRGRWRAVKRNAMRCVVDGFAPFEVVWERLDDGFVAPYKLAPRVASTVEGWVFDERGEVLGADFRSTSEGVWHDYHLPMGSDPLTSRLLVVSINDTGSNIEGIPPSRPNLAVRRLKELVLQCWGIGWQKHGAPIALVFLELVDATIAEIGQIGSAAHKAEVSKLLTRLRDLRARMGAVLPVPVGTKVEFLVPASQLPDPTEMIRYLDFVMALPYANEGAMLGTKSGSYALAEAKDQSFMRSAPAYALAFAEALEDLMETALTANLGGVEIDEYPEYGFRFAGTQNGTRWLADFAAAANARIGEQPDPVREQAEDILGLPRGGLVGVVAGNAGMASVDMPSPDGRSDPEVSAQNQPPDVA